MTPSRLHTPVIGLVGWKNSGKTTLAVRLIEEFTRRGLAVASIKHTHHEFEFGDPGTDSARHLRAGAGEVALVGKERWAIVHELRPETEPALDEILARLSPCDLVIVEGYKSANIPKIEVRRTAQPDRRVLAPHDGMIVAVAADHEPEHASLPLFHLDDIRGIARFIVETVGVAVHAKR